MTTRNEIIEILKSPPSLDGIQMTKPAINYDLLAGEIVFAKKYYHIHNGQHIKGIKIIVKDAVLGSVFFQTFSSRFFDVEKGDKISLTLTLTGVGEPREGFPDPIIFAKAQTRKGDSVLIQKLADEPSDNNDDLNVNV